MNKLIRLMTAIAATGALFLAPAAMAKTHHHHHTKTHHVVHHKATTKTHHVMHHKAMAKSHHAMHHAMAHKKTSGHKLTAQQRKMTECAHQSKGMKGAAHKEFMSKCLKK